MPEPLDARERRELCDLFEELGSEAPTLCEGWTTMDLAAHLVVRERDPRAGLGIVLPDRFGGLLERGTQKAMDRGYERTVEQVRNGPPLGPFAVPGLRTLINLNEYVVHHEDVRRANGLAPRTDRPELQDRLWQLVSRSARLMLRKVKGATVRLDCPDGRSVSVGSGPEVVLAGEPLELALYLQGRRSAAVVDVTGAPDAVAALESAQLGI